MDFFGHCKFQFRFWSLLGPDNDRNTLITLHMKAFRTVLFTASIYEKWILNRGQVWIRTESLWIFTMFITQLVWVFHEKKTNLVSVRLKSIVRTILCFNTTNTNIWKHFYRNEFGLPGWLLLPFQKIYGGGFFSSFLSSMKSFKRWTVISSCCGRDVPRWVRCKKIFCLLGKKVNNIKMGRSFCIF